MVARVQGRGDMDFDPRDAGFVADPYPSYARLREKDPVHFVESMGVWWVTRYDDVREILQDHRRFGKELPEGSAAVFDGAAVPAQYEELLSAAPSMLFRDPPDHTRLRSLVTMAFTPKVAETLRPHIEAIAGTLLDAVVPTGRMDLVRDLAFPLPAIVIAELLGVPSEDRDRFRGWSSRIILGMDGTQNGAVQRSGFHATLELLQYFDQLIRERRGQPRGDLLTDLIAAEERGDRLRPEELLSTCVLLLVAGHETTTSLIGTGAYALLRHPKAPDWLRAHPESLPLAVEELLRYESPVQRTVRVASEEVALRGKTISKGELVATLLGSANRDPAVFTDPERLDLRRRENPHLAFGHGIHYCVGASLARTEAQVAFRVLLERFPNLRLDSSAPEWSPNTFIRCLRSLPVRL